MAAEIWDNCSMKTVYYGSTGSVEHDNVTVKIDSDSILVEYDDYGYRVQYVGKNNGNGHFHLEAIDGDGSASLHRMTPQSEMLEGSWIENAERGMWKLFLKRRA